MDKLFIANEALRRVFCRAVEHIDPENVPEWWCVCVELVDRLKDTENRLCTAMLKIKEKEKQPDLNPQERAAIHACLYGGHRAWYEPSGETE